MTPDGVHARRPPLIAINGFVAPEKPHELRLRDRYVEPLLRAGAVPLVIPPLGGGEALERLLDRIDGLLLTGGDDFSTEPLGQGPTHPEAVPTLPAKQEFDLLLTAAALERDLPLLGICYGMQLMGIAGGARLLQHLPEDRPGCHAHKDVDHGVFVTPGSKLAGALGVEELPVASHHHQALDAVPAPWRVVATDDEGLVEAIERPDLAFAVGVQWHPELRLGAAEVQDRLFQALVDVAASAGDPATPMATTRGGP